MSDLSKLICLEQFCAGLSQTDSCGASLCQISPNNVAEAILLHICSKGLVWSSVASVFLNMFLLETVCVIVLQTSSIEAVLRQICSTGFVWSQFASKFFKQLSLKKFASNLFKRNGLKRLCVSMSQKDLFGASSRQIFLKGFAY